MTDPAGEPNPASQASQPTVPTAATPADPPTFALQPTVAGPPSQAAPWPVTYPYQPLGPVTGAPLSPPYAIAPPPSRGRRVGIVLLSISSAMLLLVVGIMTTLFLMQKREADRLNAQVSQLVSETTQRQGTIEDLRRDLSDAQQEADDIDAERKALADCLSASVEAAKEFDLSGENSAAYKDKAQEAQRLCAQALRYI